MARGDVVRVVRVQGDFRLWVAEILENSDHWTARVVPLGQLPLNDVVSEFRALGCGANPTPFGLVAVDVPPEVVADDALKTLEGGQRTGRWHFDLGVSPG